MDYAFELIDRIGPRLTGSTNLERAVALARRALTEAGLTNVRVENWGRFGLGWEEHNVWARLVRPGSWPLIIRAAPWSPATPSGGVTAEVVKVRGVSREADFDEHRGKLRGKIVLYGSAPSPPEVIPIERPLFVRLTAEDLDAWAAVPYAPAGDYLDKAASDRIGGLFELKEKTGKFFAEEGVSAVIVPSGNSPSGGRSGGTIAVDGNYSFV